MRRHMEAEVIGIDTIGNDIPGLSRIIGPDEGEYCYYRITAHSEYISTNAVPGQYVHVKCGDANDMVLRRPFSICGVNRGDETFAFAFRTKGKGTRILSEVKTGDVLDIMGPLGKGFAISEEHKRAAVLGGGIGIFPLVFLVSELRLLCKDIEIEAYAGYRDITAMTVNDMLGAVCEDVCVATEDGCSGIKGFVTEPFEEALKKRCFDIIYACGPTAMLRTVSGLAERYGVKCQLSLEERMGCGIGACMVCSCKLKTEGGEGWKYGRVCKDGPVFWSSDVIL